MDTVTPRGLEKRTPSCGSSLRGSVARFRTQPGTRWCDNACVSSLDLCGPLAAAWVQAYPNSEVRRAAFDWIRTRADSQWLELLPLFQVYLGYSAPDARVNPGMAASASKQFDTFYSHVLPFDPKGLVEVWSRCGPADQIIPECRDGLENARKLVAGHAPVAPRSW